MKKTFVWAMALHGLLSAANVQAGDEWKQRLETALEDIYKPTKMRFGSHSNVKEAGTILVVMKAGVTADKATDFRFSNTKVRAGQIENEGGVMGMLEGKTTSKQFKVGETLYLTKIAIGDDYVRLHVVSTEMHEIQEKGSTKPINYKAAVSFVFDRAILPTADAAVIKAAVDPIFKPEGEASATQTKTIALGQSREEVEAILGKPSRIVDLGAKVTYVYPDMKIIFVEGKVSDVQ